MADADLDQQAAIITAEAEAAARSLGPPRAQVMALARVAMALASVDQQHAIVIAEQAESLSRTLPGSPFENAAALLMVTYALARTGQHQQAEVTARAISADRQMQRDNALGMVANTLAKAGQYEHAEEVARTISEPGRRAGVLASIAGALAQTGQTPSATRLAAEACAAGSWVGAVKPFLIIAPSASSQLMRMLEITDHDAL
jgi:hypothetical protein